MQLHLDLFAEVEKVIGRFPKLFDKRLLKGVEKLLANSSGDFHSLRSHFHLKRILLVQFFLQKRMEESCLAELQRPLFLKLFRFPPSRICIAFTALTIRAIQKEQVLKAFQSLLPSIQEVSGSFFVWQHPEHQYLFAYFEVHKLRGKDPSFQEIRKLEKDLISHLISMSPLTPALFLPYNKEDSFRQIQFLQREIKGPDDLCHIAVHFQEQTPASLTFLIHVVRPAGSSSLEELLKKLPNASILFSQFYPENTDSFFIEIGVFLIEIPAAIFEIRESINLLYARRYVLKHLGSVIGPFRDTNGGLFEVQQRHFEIIRSHLSIKIPQFELFAEKVFYALHPVETWLTFSLNDAEAFFLAFSNLFADPSPVGSCLKKDSFAIFKTSGPLANCSRFNLEEKVPHARISFGDSHFMCLLGVGSDRLEIVQESPSLRVLRLYFQEGPPPSLNPYYSSGDIRCKVLSKLLFEGLTCLNEQGEVELAGAEQYTVSSDGLVYLFKLRSSFWSNGEKVTASDYVSSWQNALKDPINHPELLFILKGAQGFKEKGKGLGVCALDSSVLQIELERPVSSFLRCLSQPCFFPIFGDTREPKWFNGPYLIRSLDKEKLLLEKNAYYWAVDRSSLDQIEFKWTNQPELISLLFKRGDIDWIGAPLTTLSLEEIKQLEKEKKLVEKRVNRQFSLYFNTSHPILSSALIRRALSLAVDRTWICQTLFPGSIPVPPTCIKKGEARMVFEAALKELGLTRQSIPPLTFYFSNHTGRRDLACYLQSIWQETFGICIQVVGEEWNNFRSRLEERKFEICGTIQDTLFEGSFEYYNRFEGEVSWNFSQWQHLGYRKLLELGKKEFSSEIRGELRGILQEEVPFSPLFNYTHLYAHNPHLQGFCVDAEGCVDFSRSSIAYIPVLPERLCK